LLISTGLHEDKTLHIHCHGNLKSYIILWLHVMLTHSKQSLLLCCTDNRTWISKHITGSGDYIPQTRTAVYEHKIWPLSEDKISVQELTSNKSKLKTLKPWKINSSGTKMYVLQRFSNVFPSIYNTAVTQLTRNQQTRFQTTLHAEKLFSATSRAKEIVT
jgi:hypothetical protein